MADTGVFCTGSDVLRKAGAHVSATISGASGSVYTNDFIAQAESLINSSARYNFSSNYGSLTSTTTGLLKEAASNLAAIYCVTYDMSNYTSRIEAEDIINVLRDAALRDIALLKDKKVSDFIQGYDSNA